MPYCPWTYTCTHTHSTAAGNSRLAGRMVTSTSTQATAASGHGHRHLHTHVRRIQQGAASSAVLTSRRGSHTPHGRSSPCFVATPPWPCRRYSRTPSASCPSPSIRPPLLALALNHASPEHLAHAHLPATLPSPTALPAMSRPHAPLAISRTREHSTTAASVWPCHCRHAPLTPAASAHAQVAARHFLRLCCCAKLPPCRVISAS